MSELNFSSLFTGDVAPDRGPQQKPAESPQNATEQQAPILYRQAQQEKSDQERAAEICKEYATNTRKAEAWKSKILKGIGNGTDIYTLLYWALQAVSVTTHDSLFADQAWTDIRLIHGRALGEPGPLAQEVEAARERLEKIRAALEREQDSGARSRMQAAIRAHEQLITRLEGRAG